MPVPYGVGLVRVHTRRWWAFAGGRFVEAVSPAELAVAIRAPASWPWPPPGRPP
ncbi:hypothetical protein [Actinomadura craniellae]|uniref:hypothetical protein n=1 Tax=Actinomadura craniellae TaxID=2231787 RepID=UPI0013143F1F|nr:hypothetical protein [Actinomadura craniellae]